ncbi:predicted protein [Methanosarcina acetivorans C2A]|uniref:Uncharacterized protein n=1 Tax=Methanosarcina acetivorans (strain ATCC 35395 / DSM 2834 / JCM 12185 / C2A) TaxID=188937 RepID=Q8TQU4_METAC|nr:predicted protein [Methanosarcina acetivorans C2A]
MFLYRDKRLIFKKQLFRIPLKCALLAGFLRDTSSVASNPLTALLRLLFAGIPGRFQTFGRRPEYLKFRKKREIRL